jgi:hypothetical protein
LPCDDHSLLIIVNYMNDRFESMEDLLMCAMNETRHNYYAYALGRSRN